MEAAMQARDMSFDGPGARCSPFFNWRLLDDGLVQSPVEAVERDLELGRAVANGAAPTFRLWECSRSLVVSRQEMQAPNIERAMTCMQQAGWPVVMRETGGSAVPLAPGVLNISMIVPRSLTTKVLGQSLEAVYRHLCEPIQQVLAAINISTRFGSVPGAFCDGRYNLVFEQKKIAGTAQAWRGNIGGSGTVSEGYVLAHAALLVDVDTAQLTGIVNRFYELTGLPRRFSDGNIVSVRQCIAVAGNGSSIMRNGNLVAQLRKMFASLDSKSRKNVVLV